MNKSDDFGYNEGKEEDYRGDSIMAGTENNPAEATDQKDFQKLDPKIITSWKITRWIRVGFFVILLGIPTLILATQEFFSIIAIPVLVFDGLVAAYLMVTVFLYPLIEYRQWGYIITEDRVEIRHGIFFLQTTVIPVIRVQHVTISQGPINRRLGISTIEINTASGVFKIEGISDTNAKSIADSLKSKLLIRIKKHENEQDGK
jgi:membrane protein YdbS with pleckstrin-like domain